MDFTDKKENQKTKIKTIIQSIKRRANELLKSKYKTEEDFMNLKAVNEIVFNCRSRICSVFKEMIITEEKEDTIRKFFSELETRFTLPLILKYYVNNTKLYPCLFTIHESKYMDVNIQLKQILIDEREHELKLFMKKEAEEEEEEIVFDDEVLNYINDDQYFSHKHLGKKHKEKDNVQNIQANNSFASLEHLIADIQNAEKTEKENLKTIEDAKNEEQEIINILPPQLRNYTLPKHNRMSLLMDPKFLSRFSSSGLPTSFIRRRTSIYKTKTGDDLKKEIDNLQEILKNRKVSNFYDPNYFKNQIDSKKININRSSLLSNSNKILRGLKFKKSEDFIKIDKERKELQQRRVKMILNSVYEIKKNKYSQKNNVPSVNLKTSPNINEINKTEETKNYLNTIRLETEIPNNKKILNIQQNHKFSSSNIKSMNVINSKKMFNKTFNFIGITDFKKFKISKVYGNSQNTQISQDSNNKVIPKSTKSDNKVNNKLKFSTISDHKASDQSLITTVNTLHYTCHNKNYPSKKLKLNSENIKSLPKLKTHIIKRTLKSSNDNIEFRLNTVNVMLKFS